MLPFGDTPNKDAAFGDAAFANGLILKLILGFAFRLPSDDDDHLCRGDTLRITGAAATGDGATAAAAATGDAAFAAAPFTPFAAAPFTPFAAAPFTPFATAPFEDTFAAAPTPAVASAAAILADILSTIFFASLKFDNADNASFVFSLADDELFFLADFANCPALISAAFLANAISVVCANICLNAGRDDPDVGGGKATTGTAAAAATGDAAFGGALGYADNEGNKASCKASALGDTPTTALTTAFAPFVDGKATTGAATGDATGDATESADDIDDAEDDASETTGAAAAFGEPKSIIGDACNDAAAATAADTAFADAFGDAATTTGAAAAPLDLNPGGPGKNIGSAAAAPFAPGDLILTIILGCGLRLPLEDDHELFGDDVRDAADADDACDADDADDARDDDDNLLCEDFFELDDARDDDDNLLCEDFFELDDAYDPFAIKPRFILPWDEDFPAFLVTCFFLENNLPTHAPKPFFGDAGATAPTAPTAPTPLLEDCRDDAECFDADDARDANECLDADGALDDDELLRRANPGPLTPTSLAGTTLEPLIFAPILLKNPGRDDAAAAGTTLEPLNLAPILLTNPGRDDAAAARAAGGGTAAAAAAGTTLEPLNLAPILLTNPGRDDAAAARAAGGGTAAAAAAGTTLEPLNFAPILLNIPGRVGAAAAARGDGSATFLNASKRFASALFSFHILNFPLPSLYFSPIFLVVAL